MVWGLPLLPYLAKGPWWQGEAFSIKPTLILSDG